MINRSAERAVPISLAQIKETHKRIAGAVIRTPCVYCVPLSQKTGKDVFLKLELFQVTQAFKARGNANEIASLEEGGKGKGSHGIRFSLSLRHLSQVKPHWRFPTRLSKKSKHGILAIFTLCEINYLEATRQGWSEGKGGGDTFRNSVCRPVGVKPTRPKLSPAGRK